MEKIVKILLTSLLLVVSGISMAKGINIEAPYIREVPPGVPTSALFLTIKNDKDHAIDLTRASGEIAKNIELHEHTHQDGMMVMRQVKKITIPAHGQTELKPGGYHIMLIGLNKKIKAGDKINLKLHFSDGSEAVITAPVKKVMGGMKMKNRGGMKHMKGNMEMSMEQKMHLNPMPNLMRVFKKMPEKLNLSEKQINELKQGIATRKPKINALFKKVAQLESELSEAALNDAPLSTLDQLADKIMQERSNIIFAKAHCAESAKNLLNKEQFATLQTLYKTHFAHKQSYSDDEQGKMKMIHHVNPMPNLMLVVKKMGDQLNLSPAQVSDLEKWRNERGPVMEKQYAAIVKLENELQEAALNNAPKEKIAGIADAIMQERMKVIRGKAFCRDNMKRILDDKQYQKVIDLYKANFMQPMHKNMKM